jgi:hypothetical protein
MKTKIDKKQKIYDTVKTMREIRDSISHDIADMNAAELKEYFKSERKKSDPKKKQS